MSKQSIIEEMITYIEEQERDLQIENLSNTVRSTKTDIVNSILKELEKRVKDENQNN